MGPRALARRASMLDFLLSSMLRYQSRNGFHNMVRSSRRLCSWGGGGFFFPLALLKWCPGVLLDRPA